MLLSIQTLASDIYDIIVGFIVLILNILHYCVSLCVIVLLRFSICLYLLWLT